MIRFIVSFIILVLIVTYLILPTIKHTRKFRHSEVERINKVFDEDKEYKTIRKEEK